MSLDYTVRLRSQLGNQGFDTDGLSNDEVSEQFELKLMRECGNCRGTSKPWDDPYAPAVCQVCKRTNFVRRERAVSKPSHLQRKSQAGWTGCGLRLAKGIRVVEANCTCWACNHQQT